MLSPSCKHSICKSLLANLKRNWQCWPVDSGALCGSSETRGSSPPGLPLLPRLVCIFNHTCSSGNLSGSLTACVSSTAQSSSLYHLRLQSQSMQTGRDLSPVARMGTGAQLASPWRGAAAKPTALLKLLWVRTQAYQTSSTWLQLNS